MTPTDFTPLSALAGGAMIGLSAVLMLGLLGRIAGISGIVAQLLPPFQRDGAVARMAFIGGLAAAPLVWWAATDGWPSMHLDERPALLVVAGLLVGFGSVWGAGCTSGHGVCGLARLSPRSLVAVATFMTTAVLTVLVTRHLGVL